MGEGWLGNLQKSESIVRVLQVFRCENMNVPIHKNRATSRRSSQRHDVLESYISNDATMRSNAATFQRLQFSTSRHWDPTSRHCREVRFQFSSTSQRWDPTSRRYREDNSTF